MEERKQISINLLTLLLIIAIIIIAIMGCNLYKINIEKQMANTLQGQEDINNVNNENSISSLDINSELVKKLYNYILKFNYYDELLVYQSNKVTYSDIDNQIKLLTTFENLDESQAQKVKATDYTGVVEEDGNSYKYLYTKEIVEQKVKEIFGEDATVIHENCAPHDGYSRNYDNGIYTCYAYAGGGDVPWSSSKYQLIKAESDNENIYLYDTYIHMVEGQNDIYETVYDIYTTSDRNILIAEKVNLEEEGIYEGWDDDAPFEEFEETYMANLFKIIDNKQKTFKHTFSKDLNGNYSWVSTEIVD